MDLTEILWWSAGMFLLGILAGAAGMYRVQRKERSRELKKISDTVQRMTSGKELPDFSDCEETMDSKIRHQLLRLQEILVSQKQDAQKERKELQELISEIAHQMRTPLTNLKNYLDFLSEEIEKKGTEPELSYLKAIQSSEEKIYFTDRAFYPYFKIRAWSDSDQKRRAGIFLRLCGMHLVRFWIRQRKKRSGSSLNFLRKCM